MKAQGSCLQMVMRTVVVVLGFFPPLFYFLLVFYNEHRIFKKKKKFKKTKICDALSYILIIIVVTQDGPLSKASKHPVLQ